MVSDKDLTTSPSQLRFQYDVAKGYVVVLRKTAQVREGKGGHKYAHWETVGHIKYYKDTLSQEKSRKALYQEVDNSEMSPFQKAHLALIEDKVKWLFIHTLVFKEIQGVTITEDELKTINEHVNEYQQEYKKTMMTFLKRDKLSDIISLRLSQSRERTTT